jgi:hypothetical protein
VSLENALTVLNGYAGKQTNLKPEKCDYKSPVYYMVLSSMTLSKSFFSFSHIVGL